LTKTIEEQRKLDQEMFNQYNNIFLQQTQMLLTGLQNLSSPFPNNYPILQPFSGVSTKPMFTETSLNQSCPIISHQNNKNLIYPHTSHETQTRPKTHQTEKSISESTTIPPPNFVRSKTIQPLIQNSSTLFHTSNISEFWEVTEYLSQETNYVAWYPMIEVFEYLSIVLPFPSHVHIKVMINKYYLTKNVKIILFIYLFIYLIRTFRQRKIRIWI